MRTSLVPDKSLLVAAFAADEENLNYLKHQNSFVYAASNAGYVVGFKRNSDGSLTEISGSPWTCGVLADSCSFLMMSPDNKFLYVSGTGGTKLFASSVDPNTGELTELSSPFPLTVGNGPQRGSFDRSGRFFYLPNSGDNTISGFRYNPITGSLTELAGSPYAAGTGPGLIVFDPLNQFLYCANYGGTISGYSMDQSTGDLSALGTSPYTTGSGPDGFDIRFDPGSWYLYTANFDDDNSTVLSINRSTGALTEIVGSPYTAGVGSGPGWLAVHPSGLFVYMTDYSNDRINGWSVNPETGALTAISGSPWLISQTGFPSGHNPAAFAIDPTGNNMYISCQTSLKLIPYSINQETGVITESSTLYDIPAGTNMVIAPNMNPDITTAELNKIMICKTAAGL